MANQTAELSKHTEAANEDIATSTPPDPEISIKNVNAKTSVLQITGWKIQKLLQSMHMLKKLHKLKKTAPSKKSCTDTSGSQYSPRAQLVLWITLSQPGLLKKEALIGSMTHKMTPTLQDSPRVTIQIFRKRNKFSMSHYRLVDWGRGRISH